MTPSYGAAGRLAAAFINSKLTPLFIAASMALGALAVVALPREEEPQIIVPMVDVFVEMPGATPADVEQRVTRLEAHFEYIREDLDEIKTEQRTFARQVEAKLDAINTLLNDIRVELAKRPTIGQFWGMIGIVGAIALATVAIIITGIVGGLAWLQAAP